MKKTGFIWFIAIGTIFTLLCINISCQKTKETSSGVLEANETVIKETVIEEPQKTVKDDTWNIVEIVDEFKDPTGDIRLAGSTQGTFSNSATRESRLEVLCLVDITDKEPDLYFRLLEYGSHDATLYDDFVSYSIKDGSGDKHQFYWSSPNYSSKYFQTIDNTYSGGRTNRDFMLPIFKAGGIVKIVISADNSTYNFDFDCSNFSELLTEAQSKYKK